MYPFLGDNWLKCRARNYYAQRTPFITPEHARTREHNIRGPSTKVYFATKSLCLWGVKNVDGHHLKCV